MKPAAKLALMMAALVLALAVCVGAILPKAGHWYQNLAEPESPKPEIGSRSWALPKDAVVSAPSDSEDPYIAREQADKILHNPIPATSDSIERGRKTFATFCIQCHGATGHGDGVISKKLAFPPPDLPASVSRRSDGYLYATIRNGGLVMPSQGARTTVSERWHIVNYLRSIALPIPEPRQETAARESSREPAKSPAESRSEEPKNIAGDPGKGKAIFDAKCRVCHESDSDQKKIGPGLKGVWQWPAHTLSDGTERPAMNAATLRQQIVQGGGKMPPAGAALSDQDLADLLSYLRTL